MKRVLTGLKPTGNLTLGNYIGAIKPLIDMQNNEDYEILLFVADLHALTIYQDPALLKERIKNGEKLTSVLPEAYALVSEAATRVTGMTPFPVQLIGGIALHEGKIAEIKTGEGKTLVATLPSFLNALTGKGVHVVTVNDYLAKRDAESMGKIHEYLGLSVGCVLGNSTINQKKEAYASVHHESVFM